MKTTSELSPFPDHAARVPSKTLTIVAVGLTCLITGFVAGTRGRFAAMIADFDLKFPTLTTAVLSPVLPILLGALLALAVSRALLARTDASSNTWNAVIVCLALSCLAVYVAGVFLPLMQLMSALS